MIVHKDNPATSITKAQLRRLMMGEGTWPGGAKPVVAIGPVGDASRSAALKQVCGMSEGDFAKHILQIKFEGAGKSVPRTAPSAAGVRQIVQSSPGGLGIIEGTDAGEGVRIIPVE